MDGIDTPYCENISVREASGHDIREFRRGLSLFDTLFENWYVAIAVASLQQIHTGRS
jgi:hypothetical protein